MTRDDDARVEELLAHLGDGDTRELFRLLLQRGMQELIDAELTATIGADVHERTETRTNHRNGGRTRTLSTPAGDIELRVPSCGWARSSRICSSPAGGSTRRCGR
jgi:putative transposase